MGITVTLRGGAGDMLKANYDPNLDGVIAAGQGGTGVTYMAEIADVLRIADKWISRTNPEDNEWRSVAYGNGLFVAVATSGTNNRIMTSPDGINWTSRTSAADNSWRSVAYGNGLFVAVSMSGTNNRVMTSPDGINWTSRTSAANNNWFDVTYGNGLFVAIGYSGTNNRVMTSPDGVTWTSRTSAADNEWFSVAYGNGLFVAVATSGANNRVMTSPDGVTWTSRTSAADNEWFSVAYGNGLFVAVSSTGASSRVMTSPDGINWTIRTSAADNEWFSVAYGNGLFVAVATSGASSRVMTSPDGVTWTIRTSAANNSWKNVTYGNGLFVAVADSGTGDRVMTAEVYTGDADMEKVDYDPDDDNFVALAEGELSDDLLGSDDAEEFSSSDTYVKLKELTLTVGNAVKNKDNIPLRIKFDLKGSVDNAQYVYGRIYRNGSAVGIEQSREWMTYATKSEDIVGWSTGDKIQLYVKRAGTETGYYQNFRVYGKVTSYSAETFSVA